MKSNLFHASTWLLTALGSAAVCAAAVTNPPPAAVAEPAPAPAVTNPPPAAVAEQAPAPTVTNPPPAAVAEKTPSPAPAAALKEDNTDVIDLEEVDDSADAAKQPRVEAAKDAGEADFVDISCDNATLADILRQFRKTTRANIIYNDSTNLLRRVSTELRHVPWKDALQSILNSRGFRLELRGDILFVNEDKVVDPILTRSFTLNHASAEDMAKLFNENYGRRSADGKTVIKIANAFTGANTVIVSAPEKVLADCEQIIKAVDKAVAQIYIEARFLELSSAAMHKLGVDWSSLESWKVSASGLKAGWQGSKGTAANYGEMTTTRSLTSSTTESKSSSATASSSGSSTSTSASSSPSTSSSKNASQNILGLVPGTIGEAKGAGIPASDMAWERASGFSGQLSAQDFSLAMSAFESLGEGKIFSNPKVIVSNGKEANVDMTTKFPNVDVSSQRSTSSTSPYTDISTKIQVIPGDKETGMFAGDIFYSWGITLSVKPRISPDGLISVVITPTISQLDTSNISENGFYKVGASSSEDANASTYYSKYPVIVMKRITTEFTMKDGATAVIGGLSKTEEVDIDTGIPYLREIPWIGQKLFGWKSREKEQKEIILCVTLGIADPADLPKDMGLPQNAVIGREYVEGKRLEPGQRKGSADEVLALDKEDLDKQHEKRAAQDKKKSSDESDAAEAKEETPEAVSDKTTRHAPSAYANRLASAHADSVIGDGSVSISFSKSR